MAQQRMELIQVIPAGEGRYLVPSTSTPGLVYEVQDDGERLSCTCPVGERRTICKHVKAVLALEKDRERQGELARTEHLEVPVVAGGSNRESKKKGPTITKHGYPLDEVTSAFHKEVRLGNDEAALFWGFELYEAAPFYFWKRLLIQAAEDVGLADPDVMVQVNALVQAWDFCKRHSRFYVDPEHVAMAILLLCRAPKSPEVDDAKCLIEERVKAGYRLEVPDYALDGHTARGRTMGRRDWADYYRFRGRYLPDSVRRNAYFEKLRQEFPGAVGDSED